MDSEYTSSFFLKLDTESEPKLISDLYYEKMDLQSSIFPLETASIDGTLLKSFKSILHIPTYQDLLKNNIDQVVFEFLLIFFLIQLFLLLVFLFYLMFHYFGL